MSTAWLENLDPKDRDRAARLRAVFARLGADAPEAWASSEIQEDFPQLACFLILRRLWSEQIDTYRANPRWSDIVVQAARRNPTGAFADAGQALERLLELGAERTDIASIARVVAYETVFGVLELIDEGRDPELPSSDNLPGWLLVENDLTKGPTSRVIDGLHESLLSLDPSRREGQPG